MLQLSAGKDAGEREDDSAAPLAQFFAGRIGACVAVAIEVEPFQGNGAVDGSFFFFQLFQRFKDRAHGAVSFGVG